MKRRVFTGLLVLAIFAFIGWCDQTASVDPLRTNVGDSTSGVNDYIRIPLDCNAYGDLLLAATISGKPIVLKIDTGAPTTWFCRERTKHLGLQWTPSPYAKLIPAAVNTSPIPALIAPTTISAKPAE